MPTGYADAIFHSRSGRVIAVVTELVGVLAVAAVFSQDGPTAGVVDVIVVVILAIGLYAVFWRPRLEVREAGILVVNPFTSHRVQWQSIVSVEVRWALTIVTTSGPIVVWAVPRQSRGTEVFGMRTDPFKLPDYEAQKAHEQQDAPTRADNAALRVIQSRLTDR